MLALHQVQSDRTVLEELQMSMYGANRGRYRVSMNIANDLGAIATSSHSSDDDDELRYLHQAKGSKRRYPSLQHLLAKVFKQWYQMLTEAVFSGQQRAILVASFGKEWTFGMTLIRLQRQVSQALDLD